MNHEFKTAKAIEVANGKMSLFGQMVDKNMAQSRLVEGLVRIVLT